MKNSSLFIFLSCFFLFITTDSFSFGESWNGFYSSMYSGASIGDIKNNTVTITDKNSDYSSETLNKSMSAEPSTINGINIGYGESLNKFYLAGEIFADFPNQQQEGNYYYKHTDPPSTTVTETNKTTVKISGLEYGIDIAPGYFISPTTLLFGKMGIVNSKINLHSTSKYYYKSGNTVNNGNADADKTERKYGLRLGLGVRNFFTKNFSAAFTYIYTDYGNISAENKEPIDGSTGDYITVKAENKVKTQVFLLSLAYHLQ